MCTTSPGLRPLALPDLFTRWIVGLFIALSLMMAGTAAHAAPPIAGTVIKNAASASYSDASGTPFTVISNEVATTVQQVASLTLTAPGAQPANPGSVVSYPHTLTNTGNGSDTFALTANNTAGAFSMTGVQIFADNGSGAPTGPAITSATLGAAGSATATFKFIVQGTVPAGATAGQTNTITVAAATVFADNGAGGGANNGMRDGTEAGLAGVTVILTRDGTELSRTISSGDGSFILWQPGVNAGSGGILTPVLPAGYTATGGSAGTLPSSSYTRPSANYYISAGRDDSGVTFGMVAPNTLTPNGVQTAEPGGTAYYAHTWTATTSGQVTFSLANAASPASPAWSQVLYRDSNCNAVLDAGEPQLTNLFFVNEGAKMCLIVKQYVPPGASLNAQNVVTLSAAFSYTNAAPALAISTLIATDITTVSQANDLTLSKLVANITQAIAAATSVPAKPGDTLQYALTAANMGAKPLSTLVVSDATPAFTSFVTAACPTPLPAGMTGCAVTTQPAVGAKGAVQWTFTGSLTPGAAVQLSFDVKVDQ